MSAPELVIPTAGWPPPWPLLLEVAESTDRSAWTIVGGMMVQIHAELADIPPSGPLSTSTCCSTS